MSTGDELQFDAGPWATAGAQNGPVPPIAPAQIAVPRSAIDQLLAALGLASNTGTPGDNIEAQAGQAEREAGVSDAQSNFPADDQQSAQLLQSLPQALAGAAGAFGGALTGALQPFTQLAQQGAQALQQGLGAAQQAVDPDAELSDDAFDALPEDLADTAGGGDDGPGSAGGGFGDTAPASLLGPPPTPSAATYPASAPTTPPPAVGTPGPSAAGRTPMGAMPLMPPGAMQGGATGNEPKSDTKRVIAPSVRNGAPVQGRISTPPPAPVVTKHVKGKPVATRRILMPDQKVDDTSSDPDR